MPSLRKCTSPIVWLPRSDGIQSDPTGWALQGGVPTVPMITVSPGNATSGFDGLAVIRVSLPVFAPESLGFPVPSYVYVT